MRSSQTRGVAEPLRGLWALGAVGAWTDGQLVERFLTGDAEAADCAFAELVRRHGPMVLRVGRPYLGQSADADDAFQATFLVLIRRARALVVRESVGPWLHQLAVRVARYARKERHRREARERLVAARREGQGEGLASPPSSSSEDAAMLHEEIERLPERLRVPLLLCDLQGQSLARAAQQVGCPVGTIKSRLARARARLRERLARRGFEQSALLAGPLGMPAVPIALARAAGETVRGALSPAIARLATGASNMLMIAKVRSVSLVAALGATLGLGAFALARQEAPPVSPRETRALPAPPPAAPAPITARGIVDPSDMPQVTSQVEGATTIISLLPEGTQVEKGQVVAELDSAAIREELEIERRELARAEALARSAERALEATEFALREYTEGSLPLGRAAAEEQIRLAARRLDRAKNQVERAREADPADLDAIAEADELAEKARFDHDQACRRLDMLERFTAPRRTRSFQAITEKARGELESSRQELAARRERADFLARQVDACKLLAPADGLLIYHHQGTDPTDGQPAIREGATVRERQVVFQVFSGEATVVNVKVPESVVHKLRIGQSARVAVDAFPDLELTGKVMVVYPLPDPTSRSASSKYYTTLIELDSTPAGLRPGMTVGAEVEVGSGR
jgi:RNA polymerase sigma factor (sigma-70 family)